MKRIHRIAGAVLRRIQGLALYRRLGRKAVSGVALREATEADQLAVQRWFTPDGSSYPAKGVQHNPNVTNWVAEVYGQLAGYVQLVRHPPEHTPYVGYWLFSLYTKPQWQGLGIGAALSQAVIDRASQEGAPVLDLIVYEDNFKAIRLYQKLGFEMHVLPELEAQLEAERAATGRRRVTMRKCLMSQDDK